MSVCVDLVHTRTAYSAIEKHRVSTVVFSFVPYFELVNYFLQKNNDKLATLFNQHFVN